MKFGMSKPTVHDHTDAEQVAHKHVPGRAYEVKDPVTKLIHTIGGGFFNEPKYYDSSRSFAEFYIELLTTGRISSKIVDEKGLTEQAREVLETATAAANGDSPEDLLVIAAWARDTQNGLKLRSTPQIMLALAAAHPKTKPFVPKYATAIMRRADEIRQVFGVFRDLFMTGKAGEHPRRHHGSLPHALRKALAHALAKQSEFSLLKYNGSDRPTFADVLKMVGGSKEIGKYLQKVTGETRQNWPVSKAMFEYLVNDKYVEPLPNILIARQQFFTNKDVAAVTLDLIKEAGLTWENVVSHLGSTKEVWELCIPIMGEMALTRNLRNFEQAAISASAWDRIYDKMMSIEDTVQLPIRFFAAEREVSSTEAKTLLAKLLDRAVEKVADLPGVTMVLADNSGSAVGCAISGKSKLRVSDCGNMLEAILAKKLGRRAIIGVFGDSMIWVPFLQADSCLSIKNKIDSIAQKEERSNYAALAIPQFKSGHGVGGGTETGLWFGLDDLTKRKIHVDRMIFLSDLCCYTQGDDGTAKNCGVSMEEYFGKKATMQSMVARYRHAVNKDCFVYSVNLNGHGQSQLRPSGDRTYLLSGWSEKLVDMIRDLEGGKSEDASQPKVEVPTIEILRARYQRQ
ncbi:MAG TPA: TROVE domain-containing protein [Gemmataceae bacterium]|nr:TROVE domain-containing protein [Gemmataceae bacterium]